MDPLAMQRLAIGLVFAGLAAILGTLGLVLGGAMLPGGVPPFVAAALAGAGGLLVVAGLWLVEGPAERRQPFSG